MPSGFVWDVPPEDAFGGAFDVYAQAVYEAVYLLCLAFAPRIETWMKQNAIWEDRTGNARQTLNVIIETAADVITMVFAHGMDYGFWLETRHAGKYAILTPAMDYWIPQIAQEIERMVGVRVIVV